MKILTVVGARPQFIKAANLSRAIKNYGHGIKEVLVHTGQHYDSKMSQLFFDEMEIPRPDYNLGIHNLERIEMLAAMEQALLPVVKKEEPDVVLVYGDTNSTLAGARVAKRSGIPIAHVEAGLRSYDLRMPEELNRMETDQLSDFLFTPASEAGKNLEKEGIAAERIFNVGDIMYDSILYYSGMEHNKAVLSTNIQDDQYVLLTLHRQENTDDPKVLAKLLEAVDNIADKVRVIFPCHPRTAERMAQFNLTTRAQIIDPVGYFDMIALVKNSRLVMTDSGGVQKEAYYLEKFCITLRENTEWTELVDLGVNRVCGSDGSLINEAFESFSNKEFNISEQPYGDGNTAGQILEILRKHFPN